MQSNTAASVRPETSKSQPTSDSTLTPLNPSSPADRVANGQGSARILLAHQAAEEALALLPEPEGDALRWAALRQLGAGRPAVDHDALRARGVGEDAFLVAIHAADDTYDAVFDFGIIHHIPRWREALDEVARVLKPGGRFFFEEVLRDALDRRGEWVGILGARGVGDLEGGLREAGVLA